MVSAATIFTKTRAGADEVRSRKLKLPPKLRTMLILIDGRRPALLVREEAQALGAPPDCLEQLEQLGLIEQVGMAPAPAADERRATVRAPADKELATLDPATRFRVAKEFMNETVVNALGLKAFFFTLKLEKCATVDDLRGLADAYRAAISKASGEEEGEVLVRRLQELLAA